MDLNHFKNKLEKERAILLAELNKVSRQNPENPRDLEAKSEDIDIERADRNEVADKFESFEGDVAIVKELEPQLNDVNLALEKIQNNKFGICEIGGEKIEVERLEANPAARTCMAHINEKVS